MSEMKLIMESWRAFRLEEEEGPKFKEDKEHTEVIKNAYNCNNCNFTSSFMTNLKTHRKSCKKTKNNV